jgi:molybdopterin synthase sulfur carrier subunit
MKVNQSMIKVKFFTLLKLYLKIADIDIDEEKTSIRNLLFLVNEKVEKDFVHKLIDEDGKLLRGTIILLNGRNIHHLKKLDTVVKNGDEVDLFPPGGGG